MQNFEQKRKAKETETDGILTADSLEFHSSVRISFKSNKKQLVIHPKRCFVKKNIKNSVNKYESSSWYGSTRRYSVSRGELIF